ncbi:hypothetical protein D9M72_623270 [compost metagenome]
MTNQAGEQPGQQAPAAHRCHQYIHWRAVGKDFIDHRAVPFPQHRVVEGRHEFTAWVLGEFTGPLIGFVPDLAVLDHLGAGLLHH